MHPTRRGGAWLPALLPFNKEGPASLQGPGPGDPDPAWFPQRIGTGLPFLGRRAEEVRASPGTPLPGPWAHGARGCRRGWGHTGYRGSALGGDASTLALAGKKLGLNCFQDSLARGPPSLHTHLPGPQRSRTESKHQGATWVSAAAGRQGGRSGLSGLGSQTKPAFWIPRVPGKVSGRGARAPSHGLLSRPQQSSRAKDTWPRPWSSLCPPSSPWPSPSSSSSCSTS